MSAFESIEKGLKEAIAYSEGKTEGAVVHEFTAVDVKNIRKKMKMTQQQFASKFGMSVSTIRHWERGDRTPQGPARVLLQVVSKNPKAVLDALQVA